MGATCGARIRRRRQELGMTQLDLAERTGLSEAAVRSYELGTRNPKDAHREAIAEGWTCRSTTRGSTTSTARAR